MNRSSSPAASESILLNPAVVEFIEKTEVGSHPEGTRLKSQQMT